MRWKEKPEPKIDKIRTITKFLIFPKTLKKETRWLEQVNIVQKYGFDCNGSFWEDVDWLENYMINKIVE